MPRTLGAAALAVVLALLAASCGGSGGARPDMLLVSTRDGDYAIYELDADGSDQHRLTDADVDPEDAQQVFFQVDPAWAPDASRIAFSSRRGSSFDIYSMLADGSDTQQLTTTKENDVHPTWSPDGRSIAFARSDPGRIYVMSTDGSEVRRLTKSLAEESDPAWSPDGNWIAYTHRTPGTPVRELWLVRPDGSEPHPITRYGQTIYGPTWSPDSKSIAFAGDLDGTIYDIYSVDIQGESRKRYTQSQSDAFEPAWSPDGQTIAFSRDGAIELVDPDGSITTLTDPVDNDSSPAWNPVTPDEEDDDS
jgi:Tol biopolymer transport system component